MQLISLEGLREESKILKKANKLWHCPERERGLIYEFLIMKNNKTRDMQISLWKNMELF